jgi:hypothetical protein
MPRLICSIGGALVVLAAPVASAVGLWNLPTTGRQFLGVGYGAGYHAPLVVGAPWRGKAASPGVTRISAPLFGTAHVLGHYPSSLVPIAQIGPESPLTPYQLRSTDRSPQGGASVGLDFGPPPLRVPQVQEIYVEPIATPTTLESSQAPHFGPG